MATIVSSGKWQIPARGSRRPVMRRLPTPRCAFHGVHDTNCNGCRREVILAVTSREAELNEFRRLMGAPKRVH